MPETITIRSGCEYNPKYPPRDAKKAYVARITGRAAGALKYQREFLGPEATLLAGDDGLFERQDGERKGGYRRYYYVVLSHPEHGVIISADCEDELPTIAKLLDDGVAIGEAVEVTDLRPSKIVEGRMVFTAVARTAGAARQAAKSATVESTVEHCMEALRLLPEAEKVLAELRKRVGLAEAVALVARTQRPPGGTAI